MHKRNNERPTGSKSLPTLIGGNLDVPPRTRKETSMTVRSCIELCGGKVFYLFVVLVVSYLLRYSFKHVLTAVSTAPEAGDRMLGELAGLEWGTYRPGQYISAKLKMPLSPIVGMMWHNPRSNDWWENIRHDCEAPVTMKKYEWKVHNGRNFGIEEILDEKTNMNMTVIFNQNPNIRNAFNMKITGVPLMPKKLDEGTGSETPVVLTFYVSVENPRDGLSATKILRDGNSKKAVIDITVDRPRKKFKMSVIPNAGLQDIPLLAPGSLVKGLPNAKSPPRHRFKKTSDMRYFGFKVKHEDAWKVKEFTRDAYVQLYRQEQATHVETVKKEKKAMAVYHRQQSQDGNAKFDENVYQRDIPEIIPTLPDRFDPDSNVVLVQYIAVLPFDFTIAVAPKSDVDDGDADADAATDLGTYEYSWERAQAEFDEKFERVFHLEQKGFSAEEIKFGKATLSNILGGIGHWYGAGLLETKAATAKTPAVVQEEKKKVELLSCTPSRSIFPRGFLWDEGFHQLLVQKWDRPLSESMLKSWADLTYDSGWIPREQILGLEARSKVPSDFQVQRPDVANPPTQIALAIGNIVDEILTTQQSPLFKEDYQARLAVDNSLNFLTDVYPKLKSHLLWLMESQASEGQNKHLYNAETVDSFSWRGKTNDHTLSSGLDDYPRAKFSSQNGVIEGHVDLHCWIVKACQVMENVASLLAHPSSRTKNSLRRDLAVDAKFFHRKSRMLLGKLDHYFWSDDRQTYGDYFVRTMKSQNEKQAVHDAADGRKHVEVHVGYVSLMPLITKLLDPTSPKLLAQLTLLRDDSVGGLWSNHGILSLSRHSTHFASKENYWRGNIWVNFQYLILASVHYYGFQVEGPYKVNAASIYVDLRKNVWTNIYREYKSKNFHFEQYDAATGSGVRGRPFTGWTALVLAIMAEKY